VTHKPTGIAVRCRTRSHSSEPREGDAGAARPLYEQKLAEQQAEIAFRASLASGSGERSEKIRTYNFPQGRVTDTASSSQCTTSTRCSRRPARVHRRARRERSAAAWRRRRPSDVLRLIRDASRAGNRPDALTAATDASAAGVEAPRLDADVLLASATRWDRARLAAEPEGSVDAGAPGASRDGRRRVRREPVAYILVARAFRRLELRGRQPGADPRRRRSSWSRSALELTPDGARHRHGAQVRWRWRSPTSCLSARCRDRYVHGSARSGQGESERLGIDGRSGSSAGRCPMAALRPGARQPPYVGEDEWLAWRPRSRVRAREALVAGAEGVEAIAATVPAALAALNPAHRSPWRSAPVRPAPSPSCCSISASARSRAPGPGRDRPGGPRQP